MDNPEMVAAIASVVKRVELGIDPSTIEQDRIISDVAALLNALKRIVGGTDIKQSFGFFSDWHENQELANAVSLLPDSGSVAWPKAKDVGRIGDMDPHASIRVGLDDDSDVYVCVADANGSTDVEFCTGFNGGGKSPNTRLALINLMLAIEADNAADSSRDWWSKRTSCTNLGDTSNG